MEGSDTVIDRPNVESSELEGEGMGLRPPIAIIATTVAATPGLVVYGAGCAQAKSKTPSKSEVSAGKTLFEAHCKVCHAATGMGTVIAPSLKGLPRAKSVAGVVAQLTKPLQPRTGTKMTDFDHILSKKQKEELGAYVTVDITHTVK